MKDDKVKIITDGESVLINGCDLFKHASMQRHIYNNFAEDKIRRGSNSLKKVVYDQLSYRKEDNKER